MVVAASCPPGLLSWLTWHGLIAGSIRRAGPTGGKPATRVAQRASGGNTTRRDGAQAVAFTTSVPDPTFLLRQHRDRGIVASGSARTTVLPTLVARALVYEDRLPSKNPSWRYSRCVGSDAGSGVQIATRQTASPRRTSGINMSIPR